NDIIVIEDSDNDLESNNNNINISRDHSFIEEYTDAIPQGIKKKN
ncbi:24260_t:CDS:1, partial [Gigaspora margarita]